MPGLVDWLVNDANNGGVLGSLAMMQPKFQAGILNAQRVGLLQQEQQQQQQDRTQASSGVRSLLGRPVDDSNPLPWLQNASASTGDGQTDQAASDYQSKYAGAPVKLGASPADGLLKLYGDNAEPVRRLLGAIAPDKALGILGDSAKSSAANTEFDRRQEITDKSSAADRAERYAQQMKVAQFGADKADDTPQILTVPNPNDPNGGTMNIVTTNRTLRTAALNGGLPGLPGAPPNPAGLPQLQPRAGGPTVQNERQAAAEQPAPSAQPDSLIRQVAPGMVAIGGSKLAPPPKGYAWSADGKSLQPIPGGPEDPNGPVQLAPVDKKQLFALQDTHKKQVEALLSLQKLLTLNGNTPSGLGADWGPAEGVRQTLGAAGLEDPTYVKNGRVFEQGANDFVGQGFKDLFPRATNAELQFARQSKPSLGDTRAVREERINDLLDRGFRSIQDTEDRVGQITRGRVTDYITTPVEDLRKKLLAGAGSAGAAAAQPSPQQAALIQQARDAIAIGKQRGAVVQKLRELNVPVPSDL